jgi:hypothetical protein
MTSPLRKPAGARRGWRGNDKLILSLGSWLLPVGPPEGLAFSPSGIFLLRDALPVVPCWRWRIHYTPGVCDPATAGVRLPSPLVQRFVIGALSESRKGEGNKEGDQLELIHLSKETIPRKETGEVDKKLHPISWYRPACRTGSLFGAGPSYHIRGAFSR